MAFLNRKKKANKENAGIEEQNIENVSVKDVFVCRAIIISSYDDGDCGGPRYVNWYFLSRLKEGKYYELFSGKMLEKEEETHKDGIDFKNLDTPYIEEVEPLKKYLRNKSINEMDIQSLFKFITNMNVQNVLGAFDQDDED